MRIAILAATLAGLGPAATATTPPHASRQILVAVLSGGYAIPAVQTPASGTVDVTLTGATIHYRVDVDSIRDVTGVYLHIGGDREETPAVADLFAGVKAGLFSGVLASGTLRATDLHETTMPRLVQALKRNDVYVTVHSLSQPGEELRGRLRLQPVVAGGKA